MVGRKGIISFEDKKEELSKHIIYDEFNVLKGKTDVVWKTITVNLKTRFGVEIAPATIFLDFKQNRNGLREYYEKSKNVIIKNSSDKVLIDDASDNFESELSEKEIQPCHSKNSNEDDGCESDAVKKEVPEIYVCDKKIELTIDLKSDEYELIQPNLNEASCMQVGWGDILLEKVWHVTKIPCAFNFKKHDIGKTCFFSAKGTCKECKGIISISLYNEPKDNFKNVYFEVIIENVKKEIAHVKKRRLIEAKRDDIKSELLIKKPKQWQRDTAGKTIDYNDPVGPYFYSLSSLQKARHESLNENLGITPGLSLFESLSKLKSSDLICSKYIKQIGYDFFYTMYWSHEQIDVHNDNQKFLQNSTSCDATGQLTISIDREGRKNRHNFLTTLVTHVNNKIVPVSQLLSERNDTNIISFWLREYLRHGALIPKDFVSDMGAALRNGVCLAFNNMPFSQYNDKCLLLLQKKLKYNDLQTCIRTDIAHLTHLPTLWPNFTKQKLKVQQIYKHCIGILSNIEKLDDFNTFFKNVVILSKSKKNNSDCDKALKYIIQCIKTFEFSNDIENKIESLSKSISTVEHPTIDDVYCDTDNHNYTKNYVNALEKSIGLENHSTGEFLQENEYFYLDFGNRFVKLCYEFTSITNVARELFDVQSVVATSAHCEGNFRDIKDSLLNSRIPMRQDKFLVKHCTQIDADIKITRSDLNNLIAEKKIKDKKKPKVKVINTDYLLSTERWKNHCEDPETLKKNNRNIEDLDNYVDSMQNSDVTDLNSLLTSSSIDGIEVGLNCSVDYAESNNLSDHYQMPSQKESNDIINISDSIIASSSVNKIDIDFPEFFDENSSQKINKDFTNDSTSAIASSSTNEIEVNFVPDNVDIISISNSESVPLPTNKMKQVTKGKLISNIEAKHVTEHSYSTFSDKQKNKRKRGYYVTPTQDIEFNLQKPKKPNKGKKSIIINGNLLSAIKINNLRYYFTNTCAWDSTAELITIACTNSALFQNFMKNNINDTLVKSKKCYATTIFNYLNKGPKSVYIDRGFQLLEIMQKLKHIDNNDCSYVDCTWNPNSVFHNIMSSYLSTTERKSCNVCKKNISRQKIVIPLPNASIATDHNYTTLEKELNLYFSERIDECKTCKQHFTQQKVDLASINLKTSVACTTLGPYIFINTEEFYQADNPFSSNLKDIPIFLKVCKQDFVLCGVIEISPGHFIAHCYDCQSKCWRKRNDLWEFEEVLIKDLPNIKINSILYVKW